MNDKLENESSACDLCARNLDCANLFTALKFLKNAAQNNESSDAQFRYEDFKRRLEHLKFKYPDGIKSCLLSNNPKLARALVQESIELIQDFTKVSAS